MKILYFLTSAYISIFADGYYSQFGQDKFVNETYFKGKTGGVFLEIGAYDGINISNTYFFEKNLGWTGVCVEPLPHVYAKLKNNRACYCLKGAISDYNGTAEFCYIENIPMCSGINNEYNPLHVNRIDREMIDAGGRKFYFNVNVYSFNEMMERYGLTHIDFLSLDTEGGEDKILKSIDFKKYTIDVMTVEFNYGNNIEEFFHSNGYVKVNELGCDCVFARKAFLDSLGISY